MGKGGKVGHVNDIIASNPHLANNPFLRGLQSSNSNAHTNNRNSTSQPQSQAHRNNTRAQNSNKPPKPKKQKPIANKSDCAMESNQWIVEFLQEKSAGLELTDKKRYLYTKAIRGVKICPLPIQNERLAQDVDGIGETLARMITKKLRERGEYVAMDVHAANFAARRQIERHNALLHADAAKSKTKAKAKAKKQKGPYAPRKGSAGAALLIYMYTAYTQEDEQGFSKAHLQRSAQQYTTTSFTEATGPPPLQYDGWSSMRTLIEKGYVQHINRGTKGHVYVMQIAGVDMAKRMYCRHHGLPMPDRPDINTFSNAALGVDAEEEKEGKKKEKNYQFQCEYCDKKYVREGAFNKHVAEKHPNGSNAKERPKYLPPPTESLSDVNGLQNHNHNQNHKKRKRDYHDDEDDDDGVCRLQPSVSKRARMEMMESTTTTINSNSNMHHNSNSNSNASRSDFSHTTQVNVSDAIQIGRSFYKLYLLYDNGESTARKNRNEQVSTAEQFTQFQQLNARQFGLAIGDFCWVLENVRHSQEQYLYPMLVERKRLDDFAKSIEDGRYKEQKYRIKKNVPHFRHVYLVEKYHVEDIKRLEQAMVGTAVRDNFLIYQTKTLLESIEAVSRWTRMIYQRLLHSLSDLGSNCEDEKLFFELMGCVPFQPLNSSMEARKTATTHRIVFGHKLMSIKGVTDLIAHHIIQKYPTHTYLTDAWDACEDEEEAKLMLHHEITSPHPECVQRHMNFETQELTFDEDIRNAYDALRQLPSSETVYRPVKKSLSIKIWAAWNTY